MLKCLDLSPTQQSPGSNLQKPRGCGCAARAGSFHACEPARRALWLGLRSQAGAPASTGTATALTAVLYAEINAGCSLPRAARALPSSSAIVILYFESNYFQIELI